MWFYVLVCFILSPKNYECIVGIKLQCYGSTSLILVYSVAFHYLTWLASFLRHVAGMVNIFFKSSSLLGLREGISVFGFVGV
jgi:hypothetical protein